MTDNEWVLVPRTVTAEMEAVYANDTGAYPDAQSLHDAMLAAAPSPPTAVDQSELVRFVRLAADNIEQALALKSVDVLTTLEPGDLRQAADALASLTAKAAAPAPGEAVALPIETAPKDGTMVRLLVQFTDHATEDAEGPAWTIGANSFDNTGEDLWQFAGWCWSHDHFTEGKGTPVGWLPMHSAPPAPHGDGPDATLLKFYGVDGYPALVGALEAHVLQLIDTHKRNVKLWEDTFPPTLLPKWIREKEQKALVLAGKWQDEAAESWGETAEHATLQRCADELRAAIATQAGEDCS